MLFKRYNPEKRTSIVICSSEYEQLQDYNYIDDTHIQKVLALKYEGEILDTAPYHFIIKDGGVIELKSTNLYHNDNSFLSAFNDDIRILLLNDRYIHTMKDEIASLVCDISIKYSMKIKNNLSFVKTSLSISESNAIEEISIKAISERHTKNPLLSIVECVVGNTIIENNKIILATNRHGYTDLKSFADKYAVPLAVLIDLNPHINVDLIKLTDTVFLPNAIAIDGKLKAIYAKKQAQLIHGRCKELTIREMNIDG